MRASRPTKPQLRRSLHSSPARLVRKPRFPNVKADLAPIELHHGRKLDEASRERLKKTYSQQQMIAIEAADKVIDPSELKDTTLRNDPWSLKYYDDLSQVDPIVDKQPQEPWSSIDGSMRLKTADEFDDDFAKFLANFPSDPKEQDTAWDSFEKNLRMTVGREESERNPRSARVLTFSDIPRPPEKDTRSRKPNDKANDTTEHSPELLRLMQMTGYTARQIAQLCVKTVVTHRVVNQTRLGKIQKMYYLTVAGNGNGLIGIGEGKAEDVSSAALQSQYRAIRNMQPILRYENRTIFGDVAGKVGATELELYARPPGTSSSLGLLLGANSFC